MIYTLLLPHHESILIKLYPWTLDRQKIRDSYSVSKLTVQARARGNQKENVVLTDFLTLRQNKIAKYKKNRSEISLKFGLN